ncbi:MAG: epoxyqueuosine reductase QueH [Pseudomonadota bacterium]
MKCLLHTCCGPCTIYPLDVLRSEGIEVAGYFHRSNIHPLTECRRREKTLLDYAKAMALPVVCEDVYDLEGFLRNAVNRETDRCRHCYRARLTAVAEIARKENFKYFSSTLLYSRYQNHALIQAIGEEIGREKGVAFLYRDFRTGWQEGIDRSKALEMYRQPYCGCIYSEKDRYWRF